MPCHSVSSRRRSRRSATPSSPGEQEPAPDADPALEVALGPERQVEPGGHGDGALADGEHVEPDPARSSGVTPLIRSPMPSLLIRLCRRGAPRAGARGEARERVPEVCAGVVAADVRRVEPALHHRGDGARQPLAVAAWAAGRRPARWWSWSRSRTWTARRCGRGGCELVVATAVVAAAGGGPSDRHSSIEAAARAGRLANFMVRILPVLSIGVHHARRLPLRRAFAGVWD